MHRSAVGILHLLLGLGFSATLSTGQTLYVDNDRGSDNFNGLAKEPALNGINGPFATIGKAFKTVSTSGRIEIINTGKEYRESVILTRAGGTEAEPLVIEGNNAVISGLDVIPNEKWTSVAANIYATDFYPMSNMLRGDKNVMHWIGRPQIWWIDGEAGRNCTSEAELHGTVMGFYWHKALRQLWVHLPPGKTPADFRIEIPVHGTAVCINTDWVVVQNLRSSHSLNDGFDTHGKGRNIKFKRCVATDNCGQGFSVHDDTTALYEECHAFRNASSGVCNVGNSMTMFRNCVFADNTYEAGVYGAGSAVIVLENCLIIGNKPFEQIWQRGRSKLMFANCVIVGARDDIGLVTSHEGFASFDQCTFLDAGFVLRLPATPKGGVVIRNSIIARFRSPFLEYSSSRIGSVKLEHNAYWDGPGLLYDGTLYSSENWEEYLRRSFDPGSFWSNPNLEGKLSAEPPLGNELLAAGVWSPPEIPGELSPLIPPDSALWQSRERRDPARCRVGAIVSDKVWAAYFRYLSTGASVGRRK